MQAVSELVLLFVVHYELAGYRGPDNGTASYCPCPHWYQSSNMPYKLRGSDAGHKSCFRLPVFKTPTPFQRVVHAPPHLLSVLTRRLQRPRRRPDLLSVLTRRLQRPRRRPGRTMIGFNHWRLRFVHTSDMCRGLQHCNLLPMSPLAPKRQHAVRIQRQRHRPQYCFRLSVFRTPTPFQRAIHAPPHLLLILTQQIQFLQGPPDCVFASAGMRRSADTRASMAGR